MINVMININPTTIQQLDSMGKLEEGSIYDMEKKGLPKPPGLIDNYIYPISEKDLKRPLGGLYWKSYFKVWGRDEIYESIDQARPNLRDVLIEDLLK